VEECWGCCPVQSEQSEHSLALDACSTIEQYLQLLLEHRQDDTMEGSNVEAIGALEQWLS